MPAYPTARELVAQRLFLRHTILACGVGVRDVDDVVSECLLGAWRSIRGGQFQIAPRADPDEALRRWLVGIAWRQAAHERERAHHRREVLTPDPWKLAPAEAAGAGVDPVPQLLAREGLRALAGLPPAARALLLAGIDGSPGEIAALHGVSRTAVSTRLQAARAALAALADGPAVTAPGRKRHA